MDGLQEEEGRIREEVFTVRRAKGETSPSTNPDESTNALLMSSYLIQLTGKKIRAETVKSKTPKKLSREFAAK